ncbi:MAG: ATP-binding protein [Bacteroidota bacterium]
MQNPFIIYGYSSSEYFCNRQEEVDRILTAIENGRNITLLSLRRMGKTGLIYHVFDKLALRKKERLLYLDIMPAANLHDFVKEFIRAIVLDERRRSGNYLNKIKNLILSLKGKITFDPLTGAPGFELDFRNFGETQKDLATLFQYLSDQKATYIIAIDEFQQITNFTEKNGVALLRAYSQQYSANLRFIFSGSNKTILSSMFSQYGNPFYQSSDILNLGKINKPDYADFIDTHFRNNGRSIEKELIYLILDELECYTFYVQFYFNKLWGTQILNIDHNLTNNLLADILNERENTYYNYKSLLTDNQFLLLKAIAKEGKVTQPNSSNFLRSNQLGQASSVNRSLQALLDKEMIYNEGGNYCVYDLFFQKWLSRL